MKDSSPDCEALAFSSAACVLRHEHETHGLHQPDRNAYLCDVLSCERSRPGNGFPRRWNQRDHMKRVHDYEDIQDGAHASRQSLQTPRIDARGSSKDMKIQDQIPDPHIASPTNPLSERWTFCDICTLAVNSLQVEKHMSHHHPRARRVWICKEKDPGGTFLSNCRACRSGKDYHTNDHAAAHLRRAHFSPAYTRRGGRLRQEEGLPANLPSMKELHLWMEDKWIDFGTEPSQRPISSITTAEHTSVVQHHPYKILGGAGGDLMRHSSTNDDPFSTSGNSGIELPHNIAGELTNNLSGYEDSFKYSDYLRSGLFLGGAEASTDYSLFNSATFPITDSSRIDLSCDTAGGPTDILPLNNVDFPTLAFLGYDTFLSGPGEPPDVESINDNTFRTTGNSGDDPITGDPESMFGDPGVWMGHRAFDDYFFSIVEHLEGELVHNAPGSAEEKT